MFSLLREWFENLLCRHDFKFKSALVDEYARREFIYCTKCGVIRRRIIKVKEKSD